MFTLSSPISGESEGDRIFTHQMDQDYLSVYLRIVLHPTILVNLNIRRNLFLIFYLWDEGLKTRVSELNRKIQGQVTHQT
jgi:hypothetical protein